MITLARKEAALSRREPGILLLNYSGAHLATSQTLATNVLFCLLCKSPLKNNNVRCLLYVFWLILTKMLEVETSDQYSTELP